MNPQSPGEELEIRITALLMGELPPDEAAALQTQIAGDAALTALHARLRRAVELLREASSVPDQPAPAVPLRLSTGRRERLLAHFAGAKPEPVIVKPRRDWKWAVPFGLAASLIALLGGTVLVNGFSLRKYSAVGTADFAAEERDGVAAQEEFKGDVAFSSAKEMAPPSPSIALPQFDSFTTAAGSNIVTTPALRPGPAISAISVPKLPGGSVVGNAGQPNLAFQGALVEGASGTTPPATVTTQIAKMQAKTAELEAKNKELEIVKAELSTKTETLETRMKELDEKIAPLSAEVRKYKEGIMQEGLTGNENVAKTPPPPPVPGGGGGPYLPPASVEGLAAETREPLDTGGKVNLPSTMEPYSYVKRTSALAQGDPAAPAKPNGLIAKDTKISGGKQAAPTPANVVNGDIASRSPAKKEAGSTPKPGESPMLPPLSPDTRSLLVLQDGRISGPGAVRKDGGPTPDNPIVGRIAMWADDDTSKVNINTAAAFPKAADPSGTDAPGLIIKSGSGRLDLAGANTFTGASRTEVPLGTGGWIDQPAYFTDLNEPMIIPNSGKTTISAGTLNASGPAPRPDAPVLPNNASDDLIRFDATIGADVNKTFNFSGTTYTDPKPAGLPNPASSPVSDPTHLNRPGQFIANRELPQAMMFGSLLSGDTAAGREALTPEHRTKAGAAKENGVSPTYADFDNGVGSAAEAGSKNKPDEASLRLAEQKHEETLNIDPFNRAAHMGRDEETRQKDQAARPGYNAARAEAMWEVDKEWTRPYKHFTRKGDEGKGDPAKSGPASSDKADAKRDKGSDGSSMGGGKAPGALPPLPADGTEATANRELARRMSRHEMAAAEAALGREALKKKDYESAFAHFKNASENIPSGAPSAAGDRKSAVDGLATAAVKLAEQRVTEGYYASAAQTLQEALRHKPDSKPALRLLSNIEAPDYFNKQMTPEHRGKVEEVKQAFDAAKNYTELGRLNLAEQKYDEILGKDPYNAAARKGREEVAKLKDQAALAGYDSTRAQAVSEVDREWTRPYKHFTRKGDEGKGDPAKSGAASSEKPGDTQSPADKTRFSVTAHNRSPELNLVGAPRVANWPNQAGQNAEVPTKNIETAQNNLGEIDSDRLLGKPTTPVAGKSTGGGGSAARPTVSGEDLGLDVTSEYKRRPGEPEKSGDLSSAGATQRQKARLAGAKDDKGGPAGPPPAPPAGGPDAAQQAFVNAFLNVRKAEEMEKSGDLTAARETYRDAVNALEKIKKESPRFQPELVDFRLKRTVEAVERLEGNSAEAAQQAFVDESLIVRKAEELEKSGDLKGAQAAYRDSANALVKLKTESPKWQREMVDIRVKRTTEATQRLEKKLAEAEAAEAKKAEAKKEAEKPREAEPAAPKPAPDPLVPQPEIRTSANAFSTFSLNVSDVAFKLAAASLEHGTMPDVSTLRSEEFINAFDYRDPEPAAGVPLGFVSERARYPFAQNRDLLRLSVKTAAAGRQPGRPLNIVLLLDNSGSMERADRVRIVREAMRVLSAQLTPQDKLSIVTFSRTPRLWADGVPGDKAAEVTARVGEITPEGGTNLAAALDLGYATALKHYQPGSINHVVVLTDGAANLGNVDPAALKQKVEAHRKQGIALDCFGIGWEGLNDDMLEQLSRNGDGRYGFINTPGEAATNFAAQLAGALRVAASDVKVQVEWNPKRVTAYRQVGYAKHQLTKEQFRDNTVDAAELAAAESGNALYVVEVNPRGEGDLGIVRVRFKVPGTSDYREHEWTVPFTGNAAPLEQSSSTLRLAGTAAAFSEMLASSPFATEVTSDRLLGLLNGVPAIYGVDPRPRKLEWMIRQAKSLSGR